MGIAPPLRPVHDCGMKKYAGEQSRKENLEQLKKLAAMHCTEQEMAGFFNMPLELFNRRLNANPAAREAIEAGRALGRLSLRRFQMKQAETNATMAIFLGKVMLGQREPTTPGYGLNSNGLPAAGDPADAREQLFQKLQRAMDRRQQEAPPPAPGDPETIQ